MFLCEISKKIDMLRDKSITQVQKKSINNLDVLD